ncbi:MAG TPA: ATP synthase F1 subunit delta [Acidimicrobiales bacterium]|nr:ATP synthase F1 subunit delta [Acidimicrobiales bacterium]
MRELLRGYAAATFESAAGAGRLEAVVSELATFARALDGSESLYRILTDATIPQRARRGVVVDLLETKAAPETTSLVSFAVRVEKAGELPAALAFLVELAEDDLRQIGRGAVDAEPPAGRTLVRERIRGYAERVLQELSRRAEVDEVEDELFRFARVLDTNPSLRQALTEPANPLAARVGVVDTLLGDRVRPATLRLARYVLRAGHVRDLVGTFEWLVELAAEERGRRVAEVRCAVELDTGERERLAGALTRLVERPVEVRVVIDPSVVGGMLVSVGDLVIDGTVRLRFERLRDVLAQPS